MTDELTKSEIELGKTINRLEDASSQPPVAYGLLGGAVNFLMSKVSRGVLAAALAVFMSYHAWEMYNEGPQLLAQLTSKQAETRAMAAETVALTGKEQEGTRERAIKLAELKKITADAVAAQAEADAARHDYDGKAARVQQLRAELAQKEADAAHARAEREAALQDINGVSATLAQKRADVEKLESEGRQKAADVALKMRVNASADAQGEKTLRYLDKSFGGNQ